MMKGSLLFLEIVQNSMANEYVSLLDKLHIVSSASSIHDDDEDHYGPHLTLDTVNEDTCWTSGAGRPQSLTYEFYNPLTQEHKQRIHLKRIGIVFQGGFVGQDIDIYTQPFSSTVSTLSSSSSSSSSSSADTLSSTTTTNNTNISTDWSTTSTVHIEPDDINEEQFFDINAQDITGIRIIFNNSTDFYGRITIYRINFLGEKI